MSSSNCRDWSNCKSWRTYRNGGGPAATPGSSLENAYADHPPCYRRQLPDSRGRNGNHRRAKGKHPAHCGADCRPDPAGYRIVLTHGNGPQVGAELLRSERGASQVPGQPLDVCGASTQGEIGYLLEQALQTELHAADLHVPVATVLTQCVVSSDDPSMQHPSKPIGPFYSHADAEERKRLFGWEIVEDAARGYRRVVPSPEPIDIIELEVIRIWSSKACWSSPAGAEEFLWSEKDGKLQGVEAVIDKDRASAWLAARLGVDLFVISTDTDYVYLDYKKPTQSASLAALARPSWKSTPGPAISRPETWARKSNPCCASCARAARKLSLLLARICARRSLDRRMLDRPKLDRPKFDRPAHTFSPITTVP